MVNKKVRKKEKKIDYSVIRFSIIVLLSIGIIGIMVTAMGDLKGNMDGGNKCDYSPFNKYSNSTSGANKFFGKCYVSSQQCIPYKTRNVCNGGFLGIGQSCYESDKERVECGWITKTTCFKLKTGELC